MLETIRAYSLERLEASAERDEIRRRHAEYFLAVVGQVARDRTTGKDVDYLVLDHDHDNMRAALKEFLARGDGASVVEFVDSAGFFWSERGHLRDAETWYEQGALLAADLPHPWQTQMWLAAARFYWRPCGDLERASQLAHLALDGYRAAADTDNEAVSLRVLSVIAASGGDFVSADSLAEQAAELFAVVGDQVGLFVTAHDRAVFALASGDYARARLRLEASLAMARELGSANRRTVVIVDLGMLALHESRVEEASRLFAEGLQLALRDGARPAVAHALWGLAATTALSGDLRSAALLLGTAETVSEEIGEQLDGYERAVCDEAVAPIMSLANDPDIATALAAGRAMSESEAAAYALAMISSGRPAAVPATASDS